MNIAHIAIWVKDLEGMKQFYSDYFNAKAGEKYYNPQKNFSSYFLSFDFGCRLELMHRPEREGQSSDRQQGLAHFAVSVGSKEAVDLLTITLKEKGYAIAGEPRTTGDGYYESVVLDPEGNPIEITI